MILLKRRNKFESVIIIYLLCIELKFRIKPKGNPERKKTIEIL